MVEHRHGTPPVNEWSTLEPEHAPRSVLLDALRGAVSRPPVWASIVLVQALIALAPALMVQDWLRDALGSGYQAGSQYADLDALFRQDHRAGLSALDSTVNVLGAWLGLLVILLGCFTAGGWLQVYLQRTEGESFRRFCFGGARWFWRFVRVAGVSLVCMGLVTWLVRGAAWNHVVLSGLLGIPSHDWSSFETLGSEATAWKIRLVQDVVHALGVALVLAWGDWTRTRMALLDTHSALWASLCTLWTMARHPWRTLGTSATFLVVEAALVWMLGLLARSLDGAVLRTAEWWPVAVLALLTLAVLAVRVIVRGARYHAAVQISRQVVTPIARPDPWKDTVGGPGGPRYPIGGDDHLVQI